MSETEPELSSPPTGDDASGSTSRRWGTRKLAIAAAVLGVVLVGVTVTATMALTSDDSPEGGPATSAAVGSTTSLDDWLGAVCKPGSYNDSANGTALQNSTASAICLPASGAGSVIFIGTYDSDFTRANDFVNLHIAHYAVLTQGSQLLVFATRDATNSSVEPLAQFGFDVLTTGPQD